MVLNARSLDHNIVKRNMGRGSHMIRGKEDQERVFLGAKSRKCAKKSVTSWLDNGSVEAVVDPNSVSRMLEQSKEPCHNKNERRCRI